jgi:hypothetical protein
LKEPIRFLGGEKASHTAPDSWKWFSLLVLTLSLVYSMVF